MFENGAFNFSDAVLTAAANALAIMVKRFVSQSKSCFCAAHNVGEFVYLDIKCR